MTSRRVIGASSRSSPASRRRRERPMRQVQRRVRRLRHLRAPRSRQPHVSRPLRPAASRAGERRHRRRPTASSCASRGPWARSPMPSTKQTLEKLPGHLAIGHTRYSTAGESKLENAQPFLIDCAHGQIAVAPQRQPRQRARAARRARPRRLDLPDRAATPKSILHLYARSKAASVEEALVESIAQVRGAYSLALLTKNRLIAARDPHGFRPLALGRLGDAWIVCSETCALDLIGAHLRARRRAGRGAGHQRRRPAVDQAVPAAAAVALRLRARLLRAARQLRLRPQRQRGAHRARPHPGAGGAGRRRRRRADPRLRRLRRDRLRRGSRACR